MTVATRPGGPADAVVGVVPAEVAEPRTLDEAAEVVLACARDRKRLCFVGGATELSLGPAPEGLDLVLRTGALDRVVEHAPLDQIVTVECGVRLEALQAELARHGQMLALDPPWADRATVGGLVATGAFGPRRARHGSVRDLVIGASFVRADGARVRGGGKVVKNVAGFDLPKLLAGSHGTLGLITTVTFRLHPLPEAALTVMLSGGGDADARLLVAALRHAQLEPEALALVVDGAGADLGVRFAGFSAAASEQRDRLVVVGSRLGLALRALDEAAALAFWARHDAARAAPAQLRAKVAVLPADPAAAGVLARLGGALPGARAVFYPTLGLGFVAGDVGDPDAIAGAISESRAALAPSGGTVVVHDAPAAVRERVDVWGLASTPHSPLPLMRAVKQRLDPERRLAPGRFVGGL
jgi:glycolate oxidase FAD binding subunit